MPPSFKVGDRIRIAPCQRHPVYRAGELGTITSIILSPSGSAPVLYLVEMDQKQEAWPGTFYEKELELVT